jgi:hypothetical protein
LNGASHAQSTQIGTFKKIFQNQVGMHGTDGNITKNQIDNQNKKIKTTTRRLDKEME